MQTRARFEERKGELHPGSVRAAHGHQAGVAELHNNLLLIVSDLAENFARMLGIDPCPVADRVADRLGVSVVGDVWTVFVWKTRCGNQGDVDERSDILAGALRFPSPEGALRSYIRNLVRGTAQTQARRIENSRRVALTSDLASRSADCGYEEREWLEVEIAKLDPKARIALQEYLFVGGTKCEVAYRLGVTRHQLRRRLHRAIEQLRMRRALVR